MKGVNQQNMNGTNKFLVLKIIATQGPISRVSLSEKTGLSKMTVTALVNEYIEQGIVRECGISTGTLTTGRKPILLEVVQDSLLTLGISVGRDAVRVGIVNLKGNILVSNSFSMGEVSGNESLLKGIYMLCDMAMNDVDKTRIWGIGISSVGPLSIPNGMILTPPNFNGIHHLSIVDAVAERYRLPVYLGNDVGVCALAEMYFGNAQSFNNFFYIGILAGVGGGMVVDSKIYMGSSGISATLGHMVVDKDGIDCECGQRGCLENYCGTRATLRWAKENGMDSKLTWLGFLDKVNEHDPVCCAAVERMADYLTVGIINIIAMFDPECIYIGGELWTIQEHIVNMIRENLKKGHYAMEERPVIEVYASKFPNDAAFIGTAALVMENNLRQVANLK